MGEINLRAYLKKVDSLAEEGNRWNETLAHARHILTHYPKNAHAYRLLGNALVAQSQWVEAGEVFRRLLGAVPTDVTAHQRLSLIYEKLNQPQEALYHLERAFDQTPNDSAIINRLKALYQAVKGIRVEKVQLTAGAVANQYLANNQPEQAIELLEKAIAKAPDRADLVLQLARAQWLAGEKEDAAENALKVLRQLPYAVQANRILGEFWLSIDRPTDAQQFLLRVEEVDPYLARRIALGDTNENAYTLEELDYQRIVQRETVNTPDWLTALDTSDSTVQEDDLSWLNEVEEEPSTPKEETFDGGLPDSVIKQISQMKRASAEETAISAKPSFPSDPVPSPSRSSTGFTGLLSEIQPQEVDDTDWLKDLEGFDDDVAKPNTEDDFDFLSDVSAKPIQSPLHGRTSTGLTGFLDDDDSPPAELDWLAGSSKPDTSNLPSNTADDPLAWMKEMGLEVDEAAENPYDLAHAEVASESARFDSVEHDPLAWMKNADIELHPEDALPDDEEDLIQTDPLAWLKESGDMLISENSIDNLPDDEDDFDFELDDSPTPQPTSAGAWLNDSDALEEMMALESLTNDDFLQDSETDWQAEMANDTPQDWQEDSEGFDWLSEETASETDSQFGIAEQSLSEVDPEDLLEEDPLAWMNAFEEDLLVETPTTSNADLGDFATFGTFDDNDGDSTPDWMKSESMGDSPTTSDEFGGFDFEFEPESEEEAVAVSDEFGGFDFEFEPESEEEVVAVSDEFGGFDFEFEPESEEEAVAVSDEFGDFEFEFEPESEEEAVAVSDEFGDFEFDYSTQTGTDEPDWLSQVNLEGEEGAVTAQATTTDDFGFSFEDEEVIHNEPEWLSRVTLDGNSESESFGYDEQTYAIESEDDAPIYANETPNWLVSAVEADMEADFAPTQPAATFGYDEGDFDAYSQDDNAYELNEFPYEDSETAVVGTEFEQLEENDAFSFGEWDDSAVQLEQTESELDADADTTHEERAVPDWLNAMVPGLDVDYSTQGDEPLEQTPVEGYTARRRTLNEFTAVNDGFEWLNELVDAEEANAQTVPPPPPPPAVPAQPVVAQQAPAPDKGRFQFSFLPAWLQAKQPAKPAQEEDEFDDFDFEFDDFDDDK